MRQLLKDSTKGVVYAIIFLMNINRYFTYSQLLTAHIDHGKSTISDRILELLHTVEERDMESQLLDTWTLNVSGNYLLNNAVRVMGDADDGERHRSTGLIPQATLTFTMRPRLWLLVRCSAG